MAASGEGTGRAFGGVERTLRLAYWYVAQSRRLTRRVGALSATFPVRDERSLRYYGPRFADLGPDREWIGDALTRVDDRDTFWDVGARWGAYTAYLGRVCDRTVTVPAATRGPHLRRVLRRNELEGIVTTASDASAGGQITEDGPLPAPTVARVADTDALASVVDRPTVRLVYVTPTADRETMPAGRYGGPEVNLTAVANRLGEAGYSVTRLAGGALRGVRSL